MIELTWAKIRDDKFQAAVSRLMGTNALDFKTSYNVSRIGKLIITEAKEAQEQFLKLVNKYADINEDGSYKVKDENKETWEKEVTSFLDTKFTVDKRPIEVSKLETVRLSPVEILALEPILTGLETLEGEENGEVSKSLDQKGH